MARHDWVSSSQFEPLSQSETLQQVLENVREVRTLKDTPYVVIDLDSTLYDVRNRTHQIIQKWIQEVEDLPHEILQRLQKTSPHLIGYSLKDTFRELGLDLNHHRVENTWARLKDYWWDRFFSNDHLHHDELYEGAMEYIHKLKECGASIIYLTGRSTGKMGPGTVAKLKTDGFVLEEEWAKLVMKEDPQMEDPLFKAGVVTSLEEKGTVVASFENEPRNLMAIWKAAPTAMHIFVETTCSDHPAIPGKGLYRVRNFLM